MPTPTKGPRLGGGPAHERLILANLATSLFEHRAITTTLTRAKRVRPYAERLVTFAKRGDLASRRRVMTKIRNKTVVHELFTEIAPAMADREGGYTRIIKLENRKGDGAPMARIELVLEPVKKKTPKRSAKPAKAEAAPAPAEEEPKVTPESPESPESPASPDSPDSPDSPASPDSPKSPASPASPESADAESGEEKPKE